MGYTHRKIRSINFSFLLAGLIFAGWALFCAWTGWPRGFRYGSTAGFVLFALAAIFFCAFPVIWTCYPEKHPVSHDLSRYGNFRAIAAQLDREMTEKFETVGPFRFTATMLIYDSGHEFQMVPYAQIAAAEIDNEDDVPAIEIRTRSGRRYQWFRTWMQGTFDPQATLEKIRSVAHLNDPDIAASSVPSAI